MVLGKVILLVPLWVLKLCFISCLWVFLIRIKVKDRAMDQVYCCRLHGSFFWNWRFSSASGVSCELGLGVAANVHFWSMLLYIIILNLYRREQHSSILCTLSLEQKNSISIEELRSKGTQALRIFHPSPDCSLSTRWPDSSRDFVLFRMGRLLADPAAINFCLFPRKW